jgi:hypothetical protein
MGLLEYMVETLGEPQHARRIDAIEAARYGERVPDALIQFWVDHGRGAYLDGMHWICDPAPFDPVIALVFAGDPELAPTDMTAVAYEAFGTLFLWHRRRAGMRVDFPLAEVYVASERSQRDTRTGQPYPDDVLIANHVAVISAQFEPWQRQLFADAVAQHGALAPGQLFGFVRPLQTGGHYEVANMRRMDAVEYFTQVAQLDGFRLMQSRPGANPLEFTIEPERPIGRSRP